MKKFKYSNNIIFFLIILAAIWALSILIYNFRNDKIWTVDKVSNKEIIERQRSRGLVTSVINSIFSFFISVLIIYYSQSDTATYQALISIFCLGIIGFLLDNGFASEDGVKILLKGVDNDQNGPNINTIGQSLKFSYGSLMSPKFPRYIIISSLEIFITIVLTDYIVWILIKKFNTNVNLADIFGIVFVSLITFTSFTNSARLEWAYPPGDEIFERSE